jgi:hypothetical protein
MRTRTIRIGAAVAAVLALLVVVALALGNGGVRSYPPGSPETAMQGFLQDLFDEDYAGAEQALAPEVTKRCDRGHLRWSPVGYQDAAEISQVDIDGTTAKMTVVLIEESGPFAEQYESVHFFEMQQIDGDWLITDLDERFDCR